MHAQQDRQELLKERAREEDEQPIKEQPGTPSLPEEDDPEHPPLAPPSEDPRSVVRPRRKRIGAYELVNVPAAQVAEP